MITAIVRLPLPNGMMVAKHEAGSLTAAPTGKCAPAQVC
jgi:hypothetical protein